MKKSGDPTFVSKIEDIVGLYVEPPRACSGAVDRREEPDPAHRVTPAGLDRIRPGLPLKPGRYGTMTHDCKRNGTTTLFAALNVLEGKVVSRCMPQTGIRSSSPSSTRSDGRCRPAR